MTSLSPRGEFLFCFAEDSFSLRPERTGVRRGKQSSQGDDRSLVLRPADDLQANR